MADVRSDEQLKSQRFSLPKRLFLALGLLAVLAAVFWSTSRYPSLGDKAIMGGSIRLEDPLAFEAILPVEAGFPVWKKIIFSTINWIETNLQGMTFGILFGAGFLTFLRYLPRRNFQNRFANSALGMAIGAPLGVCVNCAAPIAKGIHTGGARLETSLSAMVASPTLNVVVLTMLFSLFPFYLAVLKVALSVLVILLVVPLICWLLPQEQLIRADLTPRKMESSCPIDVQIHETAPAAVVGFVKDYLRDFWFLLRTTVPLMILAGFLGATVATLLPHSILASTPLNIFTLGLVSIVGTFLPVPIAFDVVVSAAMLNGGLPIGFVMALLFTLGTVSVLSTMIVARMVSLRAALLLAGSVAFIGVVGGLGAHHYHDWQSRKALEILTGDAGFHFISPAAAAEPVPFKKVETDTYKLTVERTPNVQRSPAGTTLFTRREARHLGIDKPMEFSFHDIWPPFWNGRSISSGDIDNDGDPDVVLASSEKGLYVYANDGTGNFQPLDFAFDKVKKLTILNAALVDLDNDGWLDIFLSAYRQGSHVLWNKNGRFNEATMTAVKNRDDVIVPIGMSFADMDRDGFLDVGLGNWAAGWYRHIPGEEARNRIVFNDKGKMSGERFLELDGMPGESLSLLLSDFNMDGASDILVGNDFEQPDVFYLGDGKGNATRVRRSDGLIELSTQTTMAVKTADLDNDLAFEIYTAQIAGRASGAQERLKLRPIQLYCNDIQRVEDQKYCLKNMDIHGWYKAGNQLEPRLATKCLDLDERTREQCKAVMVKDLAIQNNDPSICDYIKPDQLRAKYYCDIHFRPTYKPTQAELDDSIPQDPVRNILLANSGDGKFKDVTDEKGLAVGGWSWDVKIADFDNDEWQDIYIVNGTWVSRSHTPSNIYYTNQGGKTFKETTAASGLQDFLLTPVASRFDMDNDGDLDLLTYTTNGPMMAFVNNSQQGHSIAFAFRDHIGNRMGVGNKVVVHYGADGKRKQIRELKSGGGFQSFDSLVTHFGLGTFDQISAVDVSWSTGEKTRIEGPFTANATYTITRRSKAD